jgi:RNA recognition motif-containing protein
MVKLFVGGFPLDMDELKLAELFAPHGDIRTIKLVRDKQTRVCKGYCFIEMADRISAENAIWALNGQAMGDRQLTVSIREEAPVKTELVYRRAETAREPVKRKRPRIS